MELILAFTLFVLAVMLGVELITKVPPTLHTPLMSGSNAISGITLIGAVVSAGTDHRALTTGLAFFAVVLATVNVVGGFVVTNRMLTMFMPRKRRSPQPDPPAQAPEPTAGPSPAAGTPAAAPAPADPSPPESDAPEDDGR